MPIVNHTIDTAKRLAQAAAHLRQAISLIEEVAPGFVERLALGAVTPSTQRAISLDRPDTASRNGSSGPTIIDDATFSVRWANRTCRLGNTVAFRLLERLARRPNQFVPCGVLLDELWDEHTSCEAVRSAVKILRRKLTAAGMKDLAEAIDGSTSHHYALMLAGR